MKPISRIFQTMSNSAGKDCQSAYFGSYVDLSTIVVCSDEFLTDRELVRGDRDCRANLMPIYGDLYQIKL